MGYKTKSDTKHERKMGFEAVEALLSDPAWNEQKILACAKLNEKAFVQMDELDDADFCLAMQDLRTNHPDIYRVFWWWRKAHEDAARRKEDDNGIKKESRYQCFMITQFLSKPFSDDWENDRLTLKQGVKPLISEQQIYEGLDHKTIKRWAWIWHSRDIYTEEDEITDRRGLIKAGDRKFKHCHLVLDVPSKLPISTIARWFGIEPQYVDVLHGRGSFLDGVEYLVHESPKAVEQNKTHYDDDEVYASKGFDFRQELTDLQQHRAKFGKRAGSMTPADTMRMHVMMDGWTMRQCRQTDPVTYGTVRSTLPPLRLDYLLDADPCPFRINIYVDGSSGIGKSAFCEYLAQAMFPDVDPSEAYFHVGGDDRVTFDGYDGEPVIIWEEMRAYDFVRQFSLTGTLRLLDQHPQKQAQQAKNSRVILTNRVNIIDGIQPYDEFLERLAGTYDDRRTGIHYEAKDDTQVWRRMPMIIQVYPDSFDILINQGFVNRDLSSVKTMIQYAHVRGSMKKIMEKLDGAAKKKVLLEFGKPAVEAVNMLETSHNYKISDPEKIPDEFLDYGTVKTAEDLKKEQYEEAEQRFYEELEANEAMRLDILVKFANWFWLTGEYAPVKIKTTYSGMLLHDPDLADDVARQWKISQKLTDEMIRNLATAFASVVEVSPSVMDSFGVDVLRSSIAMCWTGSPPFDLEEEPSIWIKSKWYCHMNPYSLPEQVTLEKEKETIVQEQSAETVYDPATNRIIKDANNKERDAV